MANRAKILKACKTLGVEVVSLNYSRKSTPTPDQFAPGGFWELIVLEDGEELFFVGDADEIIDDLVP